MCKMLKFLWLWLWLLDLHRVDISLRVLVRPDPTMLVQMYQTLGQDFYERVLPNVSEHVLKSVVAQFNADELLTQREQISREIRDQMTEKLLQFNLFLDDVALVCLIVQLFTTNSL